MMDRLDGTYSARNCGAVGDGVQDDSGAIQEAIDKASAKGGNVFLPPGLYRVANPIDVKPGVTVYGIHGAPCGHTQLTGSVVLATGNAGDGNGPPLFCLRESTMVRQLTVYYPNQDVNDIQPYPWTFRLVDSDHTVERVTFINAYQAIQVGPDVSWRHRLRSIHGCVLRCGISVDNCRAMGRIENVHFHPHWWSHECVKGDFDKALAYVEQNLTAFDIGKSDREYMTNISIRGAKVGWHFRDMGNGAADAHLTSSGAHGVERALQIDQLASMGLLVTGGEFISRPDCTVCQILVGKDCDQGSVRFVNSGFRGPSNRIAVIEGDNYVSFNDCFFANGGDHEIGQPLVLAKRGRIQLNNSSFSTCQPALELESGVTHALIRGNNGCCGVKIIDHTDGKATISENEPPQ